MHAVHLPPRHLWRSAAFAALLALACMALLLMTAGRLGPESSPQESTPQAPLVVAPQAPISKQPDWSPLKPLAIPAPLLEASQPSR